MAIKISAMNELRIVPIRFERAKTGSPDIGFPDIDDRGHNAKVPEVNGLAESSEIRGAVIGLTKDQEITIKLVREQIDPAAELFITSEDETITKVITPESGVKCKNGKTCNIKLKGGHFGGAQPKATKIQVRYGTDDGPIIAELTTYVFNRLLVFIQPHVVTINNSGGSGGTIPALNINNVMAQVKALWACCGVKFIVQATNSIAVNLSSANIMKTSELDDIYNVPGAWRANTINVYIIQNMKHGSMTPFGLGLSKDSYTGFQGGVLHPGVFLAMNSGHLDRTNNTYWCANDLAHEIGHFFTLRHPSDGPSNSSAWKRYDTWSMRLLMHNYNRTKRINPPQGGAHWPTYNDFGYGVDGLKAFRGGFIALKSVRAAAPSGGDGQCSMARNHIAQGPGSLY